ncbi:hypothetical protein [Accumulibacter sp.]|uniref:hypothetical protein n=1 Tax=Accumulibacter sp. TaxID=2053492 RepID=UPI0025ECF966|nr:hypothetical protein [Accumulibacter sp.]MCM8595184.1 hypothetical protein [Accumulibacter sp.]MCM8625975.1 hypothetical protein [Accumulibacter sp.]MDS4049330.1 hypothetical protein [Accumulibacter sp.]
MKIAASVLFRIVSTMIFVWPGISFTQEQTIAHLQTELVSPWLVAVDGEDRSRTLRITGVRQEPDGKLVLDAAFGWTDGNQVSVPASAIQSGQETRVLFVTQAGTQVAVVLTSSGLFEGTFTNKKGVVKAVRGERLSETDLKLKIAAAKAARAAKIVVKPSADVPESCAAFSGQWVGRWSVGNVGQNWLWIAEVDLNCSAKVSIERSDSPPNSFSTVEIKDGELSFLCNSSTGGTCVFKRNGNDLWATYSNPSGGKNSAVFEKVR